jgi:hypothetical protein
LFDKDAFNVLQFLNSFNLYPECQGSQRPPHHVKR